MASVDIQSILSSLTLEEKVRFTYIHPITRIVIQLTNHFTHRSHSSLERTFGRQSLFPLRAFLMSRSQMVLMALEELPLLVEHQLLASLPLV